MGATNVGNQKITLKFLDPANTKEVNLRSVGVVNTGIYAGGYLDIVQANPGILSVGTLLCEVSDGTYQVKISTGLAVSVNVAPSTPNVVLRWTYVDGVEDNYAEFLALADGNVLATDLIIGKAVFSGSNLVGYDYASRSTPEVFNVYVKAEQKTTPSMKARIRAGRVVFFNKGYDIVDQDSPLFVAPSSLNRIDLLYVESDGTINVSQGIESATPVAPAYNGRYVICEVTLTPSTTAITNSMIKNNKGWVGQSDAMPAGSYFPYAGATAPAGYLLCNGQAVSRTTYAGLFAAIGTAFGAGDGSTTFNVPNLKGKIPVGYDSTDTDFNSIGKTGGEKTHTLLTAEIPSHYHSYTRSTNYPVGTGGGVYAWRDEQAYSANTGSVGGGGAHNNLQPYVVSNYIIKY